MDARIADKAGNKTCVVCEGKNPTWGCFPFGVLCCTQCSGAFRELGTSVCSVRSLLLDAVSEEYLVPFRQASNATFLEWYLAKTTDPLTPEYFKSAEAQQYVQLLKSGQLPLKRHQPTRSKPVVVLPPTSRGPKSKLQLVADSDSESQSASNDSEDSTEFKEVKTSSRSSKALKPIETEAPQPKKAVRRVPGTISVGSEGSMRLGMFKNIQKEGEKSPYSPNSLGGAMKSSSYTESTPKAEIVRGVNYIGSADIPQDTITDKLKKQFEKSKKTLLNTLKKNPKP
ncbi:hypothetical protein NEHOM01_0608 [Nematocida homosporus]|uniref:uncharacterized protein n=1 Tax=Nematocida homosporus TaxID=1912981 RepID=UPI00221F0262|nr:uncharacterized protein NEHOM01_0608 [Nematocida homosporus]KAI5185103.1 hypothetical protein NEHOM01_0608 [Nematocida homosporus]